MPKVSIIVAAYNVEQYIKKCIDSLVSQTLHDIQIIIVDDGSTDKTADIVKPFLDTRVQYIFKENGGLSDARNYGLQFVQGDYIAFVDGDDFVEPEMYLLMYENAKKNDSDVVECAYFKDYEKKYIVCNIEERQNQIVKFTPYNAWNKLYKTELFRKYDLKFMKDVWYEDFNFNLKLSFYVSKTSFLQIPLYHYIQRQGSIMHSVSKKVLDVFIVQQDVYNFLSTKDKYDFNDIEWYFAKSLLISSMIRLCKYDAQNETNFSTRNFDYLCELFPNWRKSSCLKKITAVNLYLRCMTKMSYKVLRCLLYQFYKRKL